MQGENFISAVAIRKSTKLTTATASLASST